MLFKTYHLFLFGAMFALSSFSTFNNPPGKDKQILFIENTFSTALKKAKAERKYIFVDAYAIWCGPCKQLKLTTFKDDKVADFFNKNFVNVAIDTEKGEGIKLALKWDVQEYPTLLILDYNGKVVFRSIGYLNAKQLIAFGKQALK
jgi:thioredoxin 1